MVHRSSLDPSFKALATAAAIAILVGTGASASDNKPAASSPALSPKPAPAAAGPPPQVEVPAFRPAERAVSTWRTEAADNLTLTGAQLDAVKAHVAPPVARCVKLNNYWCIKKAGWAGEIAADGDGHVAFASATDGAAVAALLLKRYYVNLHRRSALAIVSRWAPAQCGGVSAAAGKRAGNSMTRRGLAGTLRGRWLATHSRGFATPRPGLSGSVRRSIVADRVSQPMGAPTIAVGLGEDNRPIKPLTLETLLARKPDAPSSGRAATELRPSAASGILAGAADPLGSLGNAGSTCAADTSRVAAYAASAAAGIKPGPNGDLGLFDPDGTPTPNLAIMLHNMSRVEIGPMGAKPALIQAGIAQAFRPGRTAPAP